MNMISVAYAESLAHCKYSCTDLAILQAGHTLRAMTQFDLLKARCAACWLSRSRRTPPTVSVDLDAVRANARWLPDAGHRRRRRPERHGRAFGLSPDECLDVARATVEAIAGRIPGHRQRRLRTARRAPIWRAAPKPPAPTAS